MSTLFLSVLRQPRVVVATALMAAVSYAANRQFRLAAKVLSILSAFLEVVKQNQMLTGLLVPTGMGVLLYQLRWVANTLYSEVRSLFLCQIQVKNSDKSFKAVLAYIASLSTTETQLVCTTKKNENQGWRQRWMMGMSGAKVAPEIGYEPAQSSRVQIITYKGHQIMVTRVKGQTITTGYSRQPLELETIFLSAWASSCELIKAFIAEAVQMEFAETNKGIGIFALSSMSWYGGWERVLTKAKRDRSSVVLDNKISDSLIADARKFLDSQEWYTRRGIPYRRGYLLYGPPGSGKTSFVQVLAGELGLDICMLSLSNESLNDETLATNLRDAPADAVVLLEDVDAVFVESRQQGLGGDSNKRKSSGGVSFSGLLNAIDGVASQEGRMFFMTTNYPDRLDSALVRPGRCDVKIELDYASHEQVRTLCGLFFPVEDPKKVEAFTQLIPEREISMAQLQGHFVKYRDSLEAAIENVGDVLKSNTSNKVARQSLFDVLQGVGLQALLPCFEWSGITQADDAFSLKVEVVMAWCPQLVYFPRTLARLRRFLQNWGDMQFMKESRDRADQSMVKKMFLEAYGHLTDAVPGDEFSTLQLDNLARAFVEALSDKHGKVFVSRWQLRRLLNLFPHQPHSVLKNVGHVVHSAWTEDLRIQPLSMFDWLKRCGLEAYTNVLEKRANLKTFEAFVKAEFKDADALFKKCASKLPKEKAQFLLAVSTFKSLDDKNANLVSGVVLPDRGEVFQLVLEKYFDGVVTAKSIAFAAQFTDAVTGSSSGQAAAAAAAATPRESESHQSTTTITNRRFFTGQLRQSSMIRAASQREVLRVSSLASRSQLHRFFAKHPSPSDVTPEVILAELIDVTRPFDKPDPPKPISMTWIARLLRLHGMPEYAPKFEAAGLATREALLSPPILDCFEDVGVSKVGHNRYLAALFQRLSGIKDGDADEEEEEDEPGTCKKSVNKGPVEVDDGLARVGSTVLLRGGLRLRGIVKGFRGPQPTFGLHKPGACAAPPGTRVAPEAKSTKPSDGLFEVQLTSWCLSDGTHPLMYCAEGAFDVVPLNTLSTDGATTTTTTTTEATSVLHNTIDSLKIAPIGEGMLAAE